MRWRQRCSPPRCRPPSHHAPSRPAAPPAACSFLTVCRGLKSGKILHIRSQFLVVTPGILAQQVGAG